MVLLFIIVHVSAFLCYLTKKRRQRKQKIFLFEEKKHLLKKSPSTNLPIDQPFILEVVFRATSTAQALSVTSLNLLTLTSVVNKRMIFYTCLRMVLFYLLAFVSAFLCCLTKKRWQRKQKNFLRESFTKERSLSIPDYHRPQA